MPKGNFVRVATTLTAVAFSAALLLAVKADAKEWPTGPIRIFVGTAPATPPDLISRIVADELRRAKGWNVVVENHPGAIQTVAAMQMLRQPADGHAVFVASSMTAAAPALLDKMPIDLINDLIPVVRLSTTFNALVGSPNSKFGSVKELAAQIRNNPDKLTYGSGGYGTPAHLIGEFLTQTIDGKAVHVPYKALPTAFADLMTDRIDFGFFTILPILDMIRSGRMRPIAVSAPHRVAALPDVPSVVEQGYPNLIVEGWAGFTFRSGTDPAIAEQLNRAVNEALKSDAVIKAFEKIGAEPVGGTMAEFRKFYEREIPRWSGVVRKGNIKIRK